MPTEPRANMSRLILWAGLAISLGLIVVGLFEHWNVALPVAGLVRLAVWIVDGVYCAGPVFVIGWITARVVDRRFLDRDTVEVVAMSWAAGWIILILVGISLLAVGGYQPLVWQILAPTIWLGVIVWAVASRWRGCANLLQTVRSADRPPVKLLSWEALLIMVAAAATLHASLPPDTRDELSYHLVAPQLWGFQGDWWVPIDNFHLLFPGNTELIWGWASAVAGLGAPRFVTLVFALIAVALLSQWMIEEGISRWVRLLSFVFLLVTPVVMTTASICYVEWPMMFFLILGWRVSRRALVGDRTADVVWTSLFWATAMGMKYTAFIFIGPLFGEWIIALGRRRSRKAVLAVFAIAAATVLLTAPWMVRNWAATGDPIYPLGEALGLGLESPHDTKAISHYSDVHGLWRWMPWLYHATVEPIGDHRLHPLWPMLHVAVLVVGWRWRRRLPWYTVVVSSIALAWFTPAPRIYLPLMLLVWLFLPVLMSTWASNSRDRTIAAVAVGLMAIVSLPIALHFMFAPGGRAVPDHLLGASSVNRYLEARGLMGPVSQWIADNSDAETRVWAWCEDRVFYLDRWTRSDSPYGPPTFLRLVEAGGFQSLDDAVRAQDIDYILLRRDRCPESWTKAVLEKHSWEIGQPARDDLTTWSSRRLQELTRDPQYVLYRLRR